MVAFTASGNSVKDVVHLDRMFTISGAGSLYFREGRDLQGAGGLVLIGRRKGKKKDDEA